MGGSEHAEAAALSGPATPDAYAAIADAFDELAAAGPRRPSKGYHELITALHQSIVQPGSSVLEIGSGGGDLLAALAPARGRRESTSAPAGRSSRGRAIRSFASRSGRARTSSSSGRSTTSSSPTSSRTSTTSSALFARRRGATPTRETRIVIHSYSQLWRPVLRVLELAAAEVAHADPELGHPPGRRRTCSSWPGSSRSWRRGGSCCRCGSRSSRPSSTASSRTSGSSAISASPTGSWPASQPTGERRELSVSILVPARNEAGMIERIVAETPSLGTPQRADLRRGPFDRRHRRRDQTTDRAASRAGDRLPRADRDTARATPCASASRMPATTC